MKQLNLTYEDIEAERMAEKYFKAKQKNPAITNWEKFIYQCVMREKSNGK